MWYYIIYLAAKCVKTPCKRGFFMILYLSVHEYAIQQVITYVGDR